MAETGEGAGEGEGQMRGSRARDVAALVAATPALVLMACGDGGADVEAATPDGFEVTPEYLAQVVEDSTSQPYRFDATMSMDIFALGGESGGVEDVPIGDGSFDGTRIHVRSDMEPLLRAMSDEDGRPLPLDLDEVDLSIDIVYEGRTVYLRAPDYDVVADRARPGATRPAMVEALRDLGDSWGRVDLDALGDGTLPSEVSSILGYGQRADPALLLDLVANARGAEELDAEEIDGEPMVGVAADVSLVESLESQGQDVDDVLEEMEDDLGRGLPSDAREVVEELVVPMEVRIDGEGHVRRLTQDLGEAAVALARIGDEDAVGGPVSFDQEVTMDFHDYGDESIEVTVPDPADTVDITGTFQAMQQELAG
jgi:hypothetical protein